MVEFSVSPYYVVFFYFRKEYSVASASFLPIPPVIFSRKFSGTGSFTAGCTESILPRVKKGTKKRYLVLKKTQ